VRRKITVDVVHVAGIACIALYWIAYALMKPRANAGDYRFFPYFLWEIRGIGHLLVFAFTAIWLAAVIVKAVKRKSLEANKAVLHVLIVLLAAQIGIGYVLAFETSTVSVGWISGIGEGCFVFADGMETRTISCGYEMTSLLKSDGTMYMISYSGNHLLDSAALSAISEAGYNRSDTQWAETIPEN